jgi:hypothetical protein
MKPCKGGRPGWLDHGGCNQALPTAAVGSPLGTAASAERPAILAPQAAWIPLCSGRDGGHQQRISSSYGRAAHLMYCSGPRQPWRTKGPPSYALCCPLQAKWTSGVSFPSPQQPATAGAARRGAVPACYHPPRWCCCSRCLRPPPPPPVSRFWSTPCPRINLPVGPATAACLVLLGQLQFCKQDGHTGAHAHHKVASFCHQPCSDGCAARPQPPEGPESPTSPAACARSRAGERALQGPVISPAASLFPQCYPKAPTEEAGNSNVNITFKSITTGVPYFPKKHQARSAVRLQADVVKPDGGAASGTATRYCFTATHSA